MIVENLSGHIQKLSDQRVSQSVADEQALLLRGDNVLVSEDDQLLGNDRLLQPQRFLQLLNGASASDQDLEDLDAHRVRQRTKELRLERLKLRGSHQLTGLRRSRLSVRTESDSRLTNAHRHQQAVENRLWPGWTAGNIDIHL